MQRHIPALVYGCSHKQIFERAGELSYKQYLTCMLRQGQSKFFLQAICPGVRKKTLSTHHCITGYRLWLLFGIQKSNLLLGLMNCSGMPKPFSHSSTYTAVIFARTLCITNKKKLRKQDSPARKGSPGVFSYGSPCSFGLILEKNNLSCEKRDCTDSCCQHTAKHCNHLCHSGAKKYLTGSKGSFFCLVVKCSAMTLAVGCSIIKVKINSYTLLTKQHAFYFAYKLPIT